MNPEDRAREHWRSLKGKWAGKKGTDEEFIDAMAAEFCIFATQESNEAIKAREKQIADELEKVPTANGLTDAHGIQAIIDQLRNGEKS